MNGLGKEKIDVLFINPRDLAAPAPYIKLANLAGVLLEKGYSCEIIEPAASNISQDQIIDIIGSKKPSVICVAAFPSTLPDAYEMVLKIKKHYAGIPIVLEGYHVNADPKIICEMGIDYGIIGDTEYTFLKLAESVINGQSPPRDIDGLVINTPSGVVVNKHAFIRDINELPVPAYHLLPIGKYYSASTTADYMVVFTARGCPYECNFCANATQMTYRYLTIDNTIKHLELLVNKLGVKRIEFMDLTFTVSKKRTEELCDAIIDRGIIFKWGCETRADKIDESLLLKMKSAGCEKITIGVESGSEKVRLRTGKNISNAKFKEVFDLCRKNSIKTMANFIFGHPDETAQEMYETIKFAIDIRPFNILFTKMVPLPDVSIYEDGVKNGTIAYDIWIKYMKGQIPFPIAYPQSIAPKMMDKIHTQAYLRFYLRPQTIIAYLPLFADIKFLFHSIPIFLRLAFGKTIYK